MKYRPEIDGLRALAIIPVILFHAGFQVFSGGFIGVDVFFVISGFLITTIIYSELDKKNFSIINFYERRARRILPILFFVLLISIPLAWISLFQIDMIDYFESLISTSLFSSNFLFAYEANYFDTSVELKPLLHTWSLAVEEQFYIIFPIFMILIWRFNIKNKLLYILFISIFFSFIFAEWASYNPTKYSFSKYNFFLLPSRAWELGIGAIIAILNKKSSLKTYQNNKIISEMLSLIGLILIILGFFIINEDTRFPSSYTILPTFGAALVIAFSNSKNIVGKILSSKAFVFIGLISYSAYLWHHLMFAFSKHLSFSDETFLFKILLSISVIPISYLSWKYIENPFRNREKFSKKFILLFSIIGSLFFIFSGYIGITYKGFPNRAVQKKLSYLNYEPDNRKLKLESWKYVRIAEDKFKSKSWYQNFNQLPNVLLVGNSHSKDLYNSFLFSKTFNDNFELARYNGEIKYLSSKKNLFYKSENYLNSDIVIIVSHYYEDDLIHIEPLVNNIIENGKTVVLVKESFQFKMINSRTMVDIDIHNYIRNIKIDNKNNDSLFVDAVNKSSFYNRITDLDILKTQSDSIINQLSQNNKKIITLDRNDYISSTNEKISFSLNDKFEKFYYDARHTTIKGAEFFGKRIDETNWLNPIIINYKK